MRTELLSFWLKPHTIPSYDVWPSLVDVFDMDIRPRGDDSEVRTVGVFAVKHHVRWIHLERRMRNPIAQV